MFEVCRAAAERGWRIGTHAVGDRAVRIALDVYERVTERSATYRLRCSSSNTLSLPIPPSAPVQSVRWSRPGVLSGPDQLADLAPVCTGRRQGHDLLKDEEAANGHSVAARLAAEG